MDHANIVLAAGIPFEFAGARGEQIVMPRNGEQLIEPRDDRAMARARGRFARPIASTTLTA